MASDEQKPDADRYTESQSPETETHPDGVPARSPTTASKATKKPSPKPGLAARLGLDAPTLIMMFKGSLPPLIGIAIYQSTPVAQYFTTLGYLVPIISVLALAILPRGKYLQNLVLNVTGICIGGALSMLALWSGVQARRNTASAEELATGLPVYNSSQSAVCGIWLFFNIWISNTLRAKYPAMNLPVMIYSIFMNVACTFGPLMVTTAAAESLVKRLTVAMLCAMGIATGVSLFVFPVSSRKVVSGEFKGAIGLVRKSIALQLNYLKTLSSPDMLERHQTKSSNAFKKNKKQKKPEMTKEAKAAGELKATALAISALFGKMHGDILFAKRDIAYGKLNSKDIGEIFNRLRSIMIPLNGISTIVDIFRRASEKHGWGVNDGNGDSDAEKEREKRVWNDIMLQLLEPFEILTEAMDQGLDHVGIVLELTPKPKKTKGADVEMDAGAKATSKPGEAGFAEVLAERVQDFNDKKGELLRNWLKERQLATEQERQDLHLKKLETRMRERDQTQLYVMLYMEKLMLALGEAVQDLVMFADSKVADGTMAKKRLIIPSQKRLKKWFKGICSTEDASPEQTPDIAEMGANIVYAGDGYNKKKDPEHLPAHGVWQHFGNSVRAFSGFVGSGESLFGFRVAIATMTVGIMAFLQSTQTFFTEQRLVWAMIMIAIGMTITAGQSIFGFVCRVGGTCVAVIFSYIIWYIVVERTAGVIVFLWLFIFIEQYFILKYPRFMPVWLITIITQVLIIGYELQVQKIGEKAAAATGQPYYPTYLLAPYRLACVAAGCFIALDQHAQWQKWEPDIGGKFPRATYEDIIRRSTSTMRYLTLIAYTITWKPRDRPASPSSDSDRAWLRALNQVLAGIEPTQHTILSTLTLLSNSLLSGQSLPPFMQLPRPNELTRKLLHLKGPDPEPRTMQRRGSELEHRLVTVHTRTGSEVRPSGRKPSVVGSVVESPTSDTSTIGGMPELSEMVSPLGSGSILDVRNVEQHGYTEFAVLQVCSSLVCDDLEGLVRSVSSLVGVVDFSFRINPSEATLTSSDEDDTRGKGKRD
ncbi:hypothetical protein CSIM01_02359 [Colletotrichum simmondsii]|uniref:Uncharacterized protein n=1 Tax=Colletotrichum simmondsii TaxID=703756 RepID=A0A135SDP1_9PEZI|nr:hypothetical protein CSIM01_02359 [Colletotrichum simmondsii]